MRPSPILVALVLAAFAPGCGSSPPPPAEGAGAGARPSLIPEGSQILAPAPGGPAARPGGVIQGRVLQTLEAGPYTYVEVEADGRTVWAAGPQVALEAGAIVRFTTGMPMRGYRSNTLDRTFELVYFADRIATMGGGGAPMEPLPAGHPPLQTQPSGESAGRVAAPAPEGFDLQGIEPPEGGLAIEQVHARAEELAGRRVSVRGRVVKFTPDVMGSNWLHLQDGSGEGATADLTVVTNDFARLGELITVTGLVAVDQDLGFNYQYPVLLQEATFRAD